MARYIKHYKRIAQSLGPTEERGAGIWVGYDIAEVEGELEELGLILVDGWTDEELAKRGVASFAQVNPGDAAWVRLGLPDRRGR